MICMSICFARQNALGMRLHQIVPQAKAHPTISLLLKEENKNVLLPPMFLHYAVPVLFEKTQLCSQPSEIDRMQPVRFKIEGNVRLPSAYERKARTPGTCVPHLWGGVYISAGLGETLPLS